MNLKKLTRKVLMLCLFMLVFAITPGFGKLNLDNYNIDKYKSGGWNRLTEETLNFKEVNCGFELHCPYAPAKEAGQYTEENTGLVSAVFIE